MSLLSPEGYHHLDRPHFYFSWSSQQQSNAKTIVYIWYKNGVCLLDMRVFMTTLCLALYWISLCISYYLYVIILESEYFGLANSYRLLVKSMTLLSTCSWFYRLLDSSTVLVAFFFPVTIECRYRRYLVIYIAVAIPIHQHIN